MKVRITFLIGLIAIALIICFGYINLVRQDNLISENDLKSLERVAETFKKYDIWYIELWDSGYVVKDKNEDNINVKEIIVLEPIFSRNHIYSIYEDIPDNMIYFKIKDSGKIYGFSNTGFHVKMKDLVWRLWKVSRIIGNNWIILNECTRFNCQELDK